MTVKKISVALDPEVDPLTKVGFVEPMGTNEGHRQCGLARHILTSGLETYASTRANQPLLPQADRRIEVPHQLGDRSVHG